jgi:hypothetical protein
VSRQSVEIVRRSQEDFRATGQADAELMRPDFVWDMSHFNGWPEQQVSVGLSG